eukprot:14673_1
MSKTNQNLSWKWISVWIIVIWCLIMTLYAILNLSDIEQLNFQIFSNKLNQNNTNHTNDTYINIISSPINIISSPISTPLKLNTTLIIPNLQCEYQWLKSNISSLKQLNNECVMDYHSECSMKKAIKKLFDFDSTSSNTFKKIQNLTYFVIGYHGGVQQDIISYLHYKLHIPSNNVYHFCSGSYCSHIRNLSLWNNVSSNAINDIIGNLKHKLWNNPKKCCWRKSADILTSIKTIRTFFDYFSNGLKNKLPAIIDQTFDVIICSFPGVQCILYLKFAKVIIIRFAHRYDHHVWNPAATRIKWTKILNMIVTYCQNKNIIIFVTNIYDWYYVKHSIRFNQKINNLYLWPNFAQHFVADYNINLDKQLIKKRHKETLYVFYEVQKQRNNKCKLNFTELQYILQKNYNKKEKEFEEKYNIFLYNKMELDSMNSLYIKNRHILDEERIVINSENNMIKQEKDYIKQQNQSLNVLKKELDMEKLKIEQNGLLLATGRQQLEEESEILKCDYSKLEKINRDLKNAQIKHGQEDEKLRIWKIELENEEKRLNNLQETLIIRTKTLDITASKLNEEEIELNKIAKSVENRNIEIKLFDKKERIIVEKENILKQEYDSQKEKEELIKISKQQILYQQEEIVNKEKQLTQDTIKLHQTLKDVNDKKYELNIEITKKETQLLNKQDILRDKDLNISKMERIIKQKEIELKNKENELAE